jgi:dihydroorotase
MTILIKNAHIISPDSPHHDSKKDILIENGIIKKIGARLKSEKAKIISSKNLYVSIGWMDIGPLCGEPGYEHRETFNSLTKVAASGGYTAVAPFPNTDPVADSKSSIQYILHTTKDHIVDYYPIGAISKKTAGEEITEMIDMNHCGAVAYSDGVEAIDTNGLMLRALQYAKGTESLIIHTPDDPTISNGNNIHEGEVSTSLGLKASPVLSEVMTLDRDLKLQNYADGKLLSHNISSAESIDKISTLKNKKHSSSVCYLNLCLTDKAISYFDVNAKVSPPLRTEDDRQALIKGINSSNIDIITSNHRPVEEDLKKKEFTYAKTGAIGLQTTFSGITTYANKISIKKLIAALAVNPRKVLDIDIPKIEEGASANLTIFDPSLEWTLNETTNLSTSKNSPFWNQSLTGKVIGVINGKLSHINKY